MGCDECKNTGTILIEQCPLRELTADIEDALFYADLLRRGLAPLPGGALDQTEAFLAAARFVWHEQNYWKNQMRGLADGDA